MLKKNQVCSMTCDAFGQDAVGVCRHEGQAVFVPGILPGEEGMVRIVKVEKRYAFGKLEELTKSSPQRQEPVCPNVKRCGGCTCQHMLYPASLEFKRTQVQELLNRVGGITMEVPPVLGMDDPWQYRNKGMYPVTQVNGKPICGFFAPRTHTVIPLPEGGCRIQDPSSHAAVDAILAWMEEEHVPAYDESLRKGVVRHIMTRTTHSGDIMVVLITADARIPSISLAARLQAALPSLASLYLLVNARTDNVIMDGHTTLLYGKPQLIETLCGLQYFVSPQSFFQVNPVQTEKLYQLVLDFAGLTGAETVIDCYCGAGTISLLLAQHARKVIGLEIVPEAIEDAQRNARLNHLESDFLCGPAETLLPGLIEQGMRPDVVVLDPPRKGCDSALLHALLAAAPRQIVYVSCNPATLSRDARTLHDGGYAIERLQCVDMFCWTGHVETVCLFSKVNTSLHIDIDLGMTEPDVTKVETKATLK